MVQVQDAIATAVDTVEVDQDTDPEEVTQEIEDIHQEDLIDPLEDPDPEVDPEVDLPQELDPDLDPDPILDLADLEIKVDPVHHLKIIMIRIITMIIVLHHKVITIRITITTITALALALVLVPVLVLNPVLHVLHVLVPILVLVHNLSHQKDNLVIHHVKHHILLNVDNLDPQKKLIKLK